MSIVPFDELPAEVQTESCPCHSGCILMSTITGEETLSLLWRDPNAAITNGDDRLLPCGVTTDCDSYLPTTRAVLHGVGYQVEKDLLDASRIDRRHQWRSGSAQHEGITVSEALALRHYPPHQRHEVMWFTTEHKLSRRILVTSRSA
jgi:hypothetical protein